MAFTRAHLNPPVAATVIKSFGSHHADQQIEIDRVAVGKNMLVMFGVANKPIFLPPRHVNEQARVQIMQRFVKMIEAEDSL